MSDNPTCATCRWFGSGKERGAVDSNCHRYPPTPMLEMYETDDDRIVSCQYMCLPVVNEWDYCGEHQEKAHVASAVVPDVTRREAFAAGMEAAVHDAMPTAWKYNDKVQCAYDAWLARKEVK